MEVYRLADVVNMLVERQLTVNDHTQTLNTYNAKMLMLCRLEQQLHCLTSIICTSPFTLSISRYCGRILSCKLVNASDGQKLTKKLLTNSLTTIF